jgi:hypothetical protein
LTSAQLTLSIPLSADQQAWGFWTSATAAQVLCLLLWHQRDVSSLPGDLLYLTVVSCYCDSHSCNTSIHSLLVHGCSVHGSPKTFTLGRSLLLFDNLYECRGFSTSIYIF